MKISSVGADSFHEDRWADGRTDMTKVITAFGNFANPPKNLTENSVLLGKPTFRILIMCLGST